MQLAHYLGLLHRTLDNLGAAYREVGTAHGDEPDVRQNCERLARHCAEQAEALLPFVGRYREQAPDEPDRLHSELFTGVRSGPLGLLRDLQDLYLMAAECEISWTVIGQAAQGARDHDLLATVRAGEQRTAIDLAWLRTRMKQAAPQALVVAG
ncbi:hypothetical protein AB0J86_17455 [Micromonospora sp. NPDC049559]|uniref:hypothetical protein n=1 Tax=Micromonospora sp. NPDC049559 TaxID=3155923 RepID=UPI003430353A